MRSRREKTRKTTHQSSQQSSVFRHKEVQKDLGKNDAMILFSNRSTALLLHHPTTQQKNAAETMMREAAAKNWQRLQNSNLLSGIQAVVLHSNGVMFLQSHAISESQKHPLQGASSSTRPCRSLLSCSSLSKTFFNLHSQLTGSQMLRTTPTWTRLIFHTVLFLTVRDTPKNQLCNRLSVTFFTP